VIDEKKVLFIQVNDFSSLVKFTGDGSHYSLAAVQ
jgi:hypothetical protein